MKRALVSVSDKSGLIEFLRPLVLNGLQIVSTGGTLQFLKQNEIEATDISEVTGFPEVLDGRVKTLHPFVHMGLLADQFNPKHVETLKTHNVSAFDLVVGNLYPFEKVALNDESTFEQLIENIDIGGPSFLRSSAKNYKSVVVVSDPKDYNWIQEKIIAKNITVDDRKKLALKVFSLTSYYDALISQKLAGDLADPQYLNLPLKKKFSLRYGENAHQNATWYENPLASISLSSSVIHQGKELSYNNLLDLDSAAGLVMQFDSPACVAVKHNNPCGAAQADTLAEAIIKAIQSDPKSIFGGIIAFNKEVNLQTCENLKSIFLECLIAPSYSNDALKLLKTKKNLRVLSWPDLLKKNQQKPLSLKSLFGGVLVQDQDQFVENNWTHFEKVPTAAIKEDMKFGEKVCGFLKSNSIALVYRGQTVGLGMGQVNRVDAVEQALLRFNDFKKTTAIQTEDVVLVSDAFFPFADSIEKIAAAGIKWIFQPGGSARDQEVIDSAKLKSINMTFSHQRHFRH
ncbi:MAG: bifunctional phosphoribosylaminoimidazolecarboxamide formyltransferase/IMP cyclohydrolase [Bdellovibrio sp.]|nr:bifunctional phosphoribosylaminoimidazolecarboxamide formyltransferase/IMP cyclohydrolase [Bdellovibrio sp.]